jgi:hypothetical protein
MLRNHFALEVVPEIYNEIHDQIIVYQAIYKKLDREVQKKRMDLEEHQQASSSQEMDTNTEQDIVGTQVSMLLTTSGGDEPVKQ